MPCRTGLSRSVSDVQWLTNAVSACLGLCMYRSLYDTALSSRLWEAQVLQATRMTVHHKQRPWPAEAGRCRQRGRLQPGEIKAESGRDRVSHSPSFAGITWGIFRKNIQNFEYFRKIKKCWKLSEKRTKPKNFENFRKKFQGEIFQIFLVLCAFWTISSIFRFFENFEKNSIFHHLPCRTRLSRTVSDVLCLTKAVCPWLGASTDRSLYDGSDVLSLTSSWAVHSTSGKTDLQRPDTCRGRLLQTPRQVATWWDRGRVQQRQDVLHRD
jgi:hypothetical protein